MARKNEADQLLRQGFYTSQVAEKMGISVMSVVQYLRTQSVRGHYGFSLLSCDPSQKGGSNSFAKNE